MTSIQSYCKIIQNEGRTGTKLSVIDNDLQNTLSKQTYSFSKIFTESIKHNEIHTAVVDDLLQYFLNGYNSCLLFLGEANDQNLLNGVLTYSIELICKELTKRNKIKETRKSAVNSGRNSKKGAMKDNVSLKVYEIYKDKLVDLLDVPKTPTSPSTQATIQLVDDDFDGVVIKNAQGYNLNNSLVKDSQHILQSTFDKSSYLSMNDGTLVVEFALKKTVEGYGLPITSWFRFVCVSPTYIEDHSWILQNNNPPPTGQSIRNSTPGIQSESPSSSMVQKLLADSIGGNCITKLFLTLEPYLSTSNKTLLDTSMSISKIFNYPIDNTPHIKGLLRQYRFQLKGLEKALSREKNVNEAYIEELKEKIVFLEQTNFQLNDDKSGLESMLNDTKEKYSQAVVLHTEVSSKNVFSNAEKLKMSKDAIELRIQANKLQQEAEKQIFDMKNMLLAEEEKCSKLERNLAFEHKTHSNLKEKFDRLKCDNDELMDEYVNLKSNYQTITINFQQQGQVNDELNETIAKLSQLKDKIVVEKNDAQYHQIKEFNEQLLKLKKSLTNPVEDAIKTGTKSVFTPKRFIMKEDFSEEEMEKLRDQHHKELQDLEKMLFVLKKTLNEKEETISSYKKKLAHSTSRMLMMEDERDFTDGRLSEMENSLTKLSTEYKARLEQYINDLKDYLSNSNADTKESKEYQEQIDKMFQDLHNAHTNQLQRQQTSIEHLRNTSETILHKHEKLLIAYRMLVQKYNESYDETDVLSYEIILPPDDEIQAKSLKERNELRTKLFISEERVKEMEEKIEHFKIRIKRLEETGSVHEGDSNDPWNGVKRKVREFTVSVQHNLEKEKAELLTRCHLAEQQLETYHEMMEEDTRKYEYEINHLQQLLNEYNHNDPHMRMKANYHDDRLAIGYDKAHFLPPIQTQRYKSYDTSR